MTLGGRIDIFAAADETFPPPKTGKERGELAELQFALAAVRQGFDLAKPLGDSQPYDFIVRGRCLWRVQVRSRHVRNDFGYRVGLAHGFNKRCYEDDAFDFLAVYLAPSDAWYIIPFEKVRGVKAFALYPETKNSRARFANYRDAWHLMR
jgi:hypothetical protein